MFCLVSNTLCFLEHFYSGFIPTFAPVSRYLPDFSYLTLVASLYGLYLYVNMFKAPPSCTVAFICLYVVFFILFAATWAFRCIGKQWIYTPLVFLCSKILLYVATLFYLTAVSYHFPSVRLNNETTTCNEQHVYVMWRVSTSWRKQSTASSSNMVHGRLIPYYTSYWTETHGPRLTTNCSNGMHCFACRHGYRSGWRVMRVVR